MDGQAMPSKTPQQPTQYKKKPQKTRLHFDLYLKSAVIFICILN